MGLHLHKLPVAVVLSLASTVAWASESTYQVTSKDQSVTKNNWIEYNDAEATGAQWIAPQGSNVIVVSKVFTPPAGSVFVQFSGYSTYVDIKQNPDGLQNVALQDSLIRYPG